MCVGELQAGGRASERAGGQAGGPAGAGSLRLSADENKQRSPTQGIFFCQLLPPHTACIHGRCALLGDNIAEMAHK